MKKLSQAIFTLGGKGTRLVKITNETPKPLWNINGINTIERAINNLISQGILNYIWITNYKPKLFEVEAKRLEKKYNIDIKIHKEASPKGEAGSLIDILEMLDEKFIFVNGDIIFNVDISRMNNFHIKNDADITFMTHLTTHSEDSDCIIESPSNSISEYKFKNEKIDSQYFFLGNAGLSLLTKNIVKSIQNKFLKENFMLNLFRDFIVESHNAGFKVFSYNTSEYLKDMGTPQRLLQVENDLNNKIVDKLSYLNKQKVLFLDRDNTLIKCKNNEYIVSNKEIEIFEKRLENIKKISSKYNFILFITNQPQIAMGKVSWQEAININGEIIKECQKRGLSIAGFYMCPHHPHSGFRNEIAELKYNCFCRKPLPGLFFEASYHRNIDLGNSLMIGDSWRDKIAAKNAGIKFLDATSLD
mgnify:CR=1 FL=1|tara:strand:- start:3544 stop:4791 length:1248 start_codon:yes stop_codon:yes gene_type:complete